jgi:formate dehydrogenase subunit gamma
MKSEVVRYSMGERICHWMAAASYVYCLSTGLAFYSPYLFWLAVALGGGPTSRYWHPLLGVAFFLVQMWMHAIWSRDMRITNADRAWMKEIRNYIENRDDRVPPAGRFNAGQKQFYWMMYWGAFGLLASGVLLWFPEWIPFRLAWLRPIVIVVHEISALLTIGAFMIHIYMGVFLVPSGLRGITIGRVPRAWAAAHHRLWLEEISQREVPLPTPTRPGAHAD